MNTNPNRSNPLTAVKDYSSRVLNFVKEHGPGFLSRAIEVYASGTRALATTALSKSGVDVRSGVIAGLLTVVLFWMTNFFLSWGVSNRYYNYKPEALQQVATLGDAKRELRLAGWIPDDGGAANKAIQKIQDKDFTQPLYRWLEIEFLSSGMDKEDSELSRSLRKLVMGNPRGWLLVSADIATGTDVYSQLYKQKPTIMSIVDSDPIRKKTCLAMLDDLTSAVQQKMRLQMRINGFIQFVTVFVGIFTLTALVRRYFLITRMAGIWLGPNLDTTMESTTTDSQTQELKEIVERLRQTSDSDAEASIREEIERLGEDTTNEIYDGYWFLAGIMPSLGFIGTVIGMSSSLMLADRLFVDEDRQLAIGRMTSELGLAFDTTLVALVLGIITSIPLAAMRSRERTFFREFAASIAEYRGRRAEGSES